MKLFIFAVLCVVACSGQYWATPYAAYSPWAYSYPWNSWAHAPVVLGHNGVPVDTPEVQAARAAHLHAHTAITGVPQDTAEVAAAKAEHFAAHARARAGHSVHKRSIHAYAAPWVSYNGAPIDTPEVQAAKAEHYAAHARALSGQHAVVAAPYATLYPHAPLGPDGRVVDTAEVAQAKAVHFAAHAQAQGHGVVNGVPLDTPEVASAKASHFAAVAEAKGRAGYWNGAWDRSWDDGQWDGRWNHLVYAGNYYGQHIPVIQNGVPVETPEVQHAKAAHAAAHVEANARNAWSGHW